MNLISPPPIQKRSFVLNWQTVVGYLLLMMSAVGFVIHPAIGGAMDITALALLVFGHINEQNKADKIQEAHASETKALQEELEATKKLTAKLEFQQTPQMIPDEHRQAFVDALSVFEDQKFMIICADEMFDRIFATHLSAILTSQCGWVHPSGLKMLAIRPHKVYQLPPPGVRVCLPFRFDKPEQKSIDAAIALFYALEKCGIGMFKHQSEPHPEIFDVSDSGPNVIEIRIGPKANPEEVA